ncbi:hypothetical protein OSSY52_00930 [Tepiditoga spiralis]|uniref:Uncharacterized protein n=1 Tax=Tepiditoga spiralis TaxID=2108365 RepID=A0A7G1G7F4_9BACT|nr:hypothetical protein [Tepiditoga spiralis]BBE29952.1 hypothetical protein OSSY52_00930 [Tepiditoga spiralis]
MKKIILIFLIIFSIQIFSITLENIYNLSKNSSTLDKSWKELVLYIQKNGSNQQLERYGEIISAKKYLYNKYKNFKFINTIISEDLKEFLIGIGIIDFNFSEEDTKKILYIFKNLPKTIQNILESGKMEEINLKYSYKIKGLNSYVNQKSDDLFLKYLIDKTIQNPPFFDKDMQNFVNTFISKSHIIKMNEIIESSRYYIQEKDFMGGYNLLKFLYEKNYISDKNLKQYYKLKTYFELKNKLSTYASTVYTFENQEIEKYTYDVLSLINSVSNLTLSKKMLEDILYSIVKVLNTRIEKLDKKLNVDFSNIQINNLNEELSNEIIKLKLKLNYSKDIIKNASNNKTEKSNKIKTNFFIEYLFIFLVIITLIILMLLFELFPSEKKVEFLCKIGMGKYGLRLTEKLILKNPNYYKYYILLATVYEVIGDFEKSISAYKTATNLKKKSGGNE